MNSNELCIFQKCLRIIGPAYELLFHIATDVLDQLVFHPRYSWCWSTLHVLLTLQWLQLSSTLQRNVSVHCPIFLAYLHLLPSARAIEWRQFCWIMLQSWVAFDQSHQRNQPAFLLTAVIQPRWTCSSMLQYGSVWRNHNHFLWKKQLN